MIARKKMRYVEDENKQFQELLSKHIMPLYETIYNETDMGLEDQIFNSKISLATLLIIKNLVPVFRKIYRGYFGNEVRRPLSGKNFINKTEKDLFCFLKDFDICPYLATKSVAHALFYETYSTEIQKLTNNKDFADITQLFGGDDEGIDFTFARFLAYMVRIGIYIFSDTNNLPVSQKDLEFTNDEKFYL